MEVWKDIIDFPNYQVSNLGRVKSKGKILKSTKDNGGYLMAEVFRDFLEPLDLVEKVEE